jgi:hypothetical protein
MFNKIETYANQILKFSYIYFSFDVDGFFVVCYVLEVFSKSNQPSNFQLKYKCCMFCNTMLVSSFGVKFIT